MHHRRITCSGGAAMSYITFKPPVQYGWVCPLCGFAYAPNMVKCFCNSAAAKVTKTTDTGTYYPNVTVSTDTEASK